jgi:hypothetical protein
LHFAHQTAQVSFFFSGGERVRIFVAELRLCHYFTGKHSEANAQSANLILPQPAKATALMRKTHSNSRLDFEIQASE